MSSITKISPAIQEWIPDGFYVDDRTLDVRGKCKLIRILLVEDNPGEVR